MNLFKKGSSFSRTDQGTTNKGTPLNPNAAEFIPSARRTLLGTASIADAASKFPASGTLGKQVLDRSESSISTNSDEEARQYWQRQLPDDITPDFKVMGEDLSDRGGSMSLAGLSLHDGREANTYSAAMGSAYVLNEQLAIGPRHGNGGTFIDKIRYPVSSYKEDPSPVNFLPIPASPWEKQVMNNDNLKHNGNFEESVRHGYPNHMAGENAINENHNVNLLEFLASKFPGFAIDSLAEVYFANCCDLHLTIEMLTQLELQVDGGFNLNMNSKELSAPNLSSLDFPALPHNKTGLPKYSGDEVQQTVNCDRSLDKDNMFSYKSSSSLSSRGSTDFASAVKKLASQDSGLWKYDRNDSADASVGSSRTSLNLATSYSSGLARSEYGDRLLSCGTARATPAWIETGDAVASLYSELREEAQEHARLQNAYLEQARQAFFIGNKALAKELSMKGQMHNMQMKAAHIKAQESTYHQRNPVSLELQGSGRVQDRMIDLHGLHVNEAIHVLKHELTALRSATRSSDQHLHVLICVGTGHHTRGSRTPARLPIAVQRYLLEEEGLEYVEPQPGLLQVVIY
ncbi:hypothetical protein Nepgr_013610 [Nepenthes gracilis]|uniref:Smr domain-containing protein n=1 Tax=Nepenthes gracilis TaxID=150966 RepID=A0AAD3SJ64_NEPGR|nr:hypothetical protein Nepgr_013610 [Nepenthes gracilis]